MKTLHIDYPIWTGDTLYAIKDSKMVEYTVIQVHTELNDCPNTSDCYIKTTYIVDSSNDRRTITDKDINTIYYIDKKELIQKIVAQL